MSSNDEYVEGVTLNKGKIESQILKLLEKDLKSSQKTNSSSSSSASSSSSSSIPSTLVNLFSFKKKFTDVFVVFVLAGSFNPPHLGHIANFIAAKKAVEQAGNYRVVGGYLQPSSDSYVRSKLEDEAISLYHRNYLCELITKDSDWIDYCGWGWASGFQATTQIQKILRSWVSAHSIFGPIIPQENILCVFLAGADLALRMSLWQHKYLSVCLARDGSTAEVKKRYRAWAAVNKYDKSKRKHNMREFVLVEDKSLINISSTEIRDSLKTEGYKEMVTKGWITQSVSDYLESHKSNLSLPKKKARRYS